MSSAVRTRVAALYTLPRSSPYLSIAGVDCWDKKRNAMCYPGPFPVIMHPPCAPWSLAVAHQLIPSLDQHPVLAQLAVFQVQRWCGILEQPADSRLWGKLRLPYPEGYFAKAVAGPRFDAWGGWTLEVEQGDFGHKLRKRTWLYMVGIDSGDVSMPPRRPPPGRNLGKIRTDKRSGRTWRRSVLGDLSPDDRKRTPPAFADWLVELASGARPKRNLELYP